jgi:hypothetical protein
MAMGLPISARIAIATWPVSVDYYAPKQQKGPGKPEPFELRTTGAGEGIRTLDLNLGKVALYR